MNTITERLYIIPFLQQKDLDFFIKQFKVSGIELIEDVTYHLKGEQLPACALIGDNNLESIIQKSLLLYIPNHDNYQVVYWDKGMEDVTYNKQGVVRLTMGRWVKAISKEAFSPESGWVQIGGSYFHYIKV